VVSLSEITSEADRFAAELAARLSDEQENRFQGMPSDGDSRAGYRAMGERGWIGLHWPEELGGRGLDPLLTVAAEERFGYHWLPLSSYLLSVKTIGNALLDHASGELQERLLPEIAAGRLVFCQGFSEPEAGSDLASLRTTARRDGDRFLVSGHKTWTSSAQLADWIYLAVRTDTAAARPHRGVSVLVAEMDSPGIEVREIEVVGGGVLNEVFLDEVSVPAAQLVGEENGGWRVLMSTLDHERVTSEKIGIVLRVLEDLEDALADAGSPAHAGEARLGLRRLHGEAQAARLLGQRAVRMIAEGRPAAAPAAMAKLSMSTLAKRTAEAGTRLLGPRALVEEGPEAIGEGRLAGVTRATAGSSIAGGASEIQKRVIARQGLGCAA
jgi:alkylation response protein AidB-like acyl-CoA dehydrogenase